METTFFSPPEHLKVNVRILYKGQPLSKEYYEEHPELHKLYPSKAEFDKTYRGLRQTEIPAGKKIVLEISENGVKNWIADF